MNRSRLVSRAGAAALLLALLAAALNSSPGKARTLVEIDHTTKTITLIVQANAPSAHPDDVAYIEQAFSDFWGQNTFTYRCYQVRFTLDLTTEWPGDRSRHQIAVVPIHAGDSFTDRVDGTGSQAAWMWLDTFSDPWTVAHEFGHVLGLPDEYLQIFDGAGKRWTVPDPTKAPEYTWSDADRDGNFEQSDVWRDDGDGVIERNEWFPPTVREGEAGSLMADNSLPNSILDRHINTITARHVNPNDLSCKWTGTYEERATASGSTVAYAEYTAEGTLTFEEDEAGMISGTAELTLNGLTDYVDDECGDMRLSMEPATVTLGVTGQRTGPDTMQINLTGDAAALTFPFDFDLPCTGDVTLPWNYFVVLITPGWIPPLERDADGYTGELDAQAPGGGWRKLVIVKPVQEAGVG